MVEKAKIVYGREMVRDSIRIVAKVFDFLSKKESRDQVGWIRRAQTRARSSLGKRYLYRGIQPSQKFVKNVNGVRRIAFML